MINPTHKLFRKYVPFLISLSILFGVDEVINFRHLTVEDHGLSESTVYDVFQDSRGYMWISTDNGLNKYDGYSMESYQYMHFDSLSISKGAPRYIFEDNSGKIWIATSAGLLNKLDIETGVFKRINPNAIPNLRLNNNSLKVKQLPDGRFICPMSGYLVLMDENGNNLRNIKMVQDSTLKEGFYDKLTAIANIENSIARIANPGDDVNITEELSINSSDSIYVVLMGEYQLSDNNGRFDYGWIEDELGKKVWSPWDLDTLNADYAGGASSNRLTVEKIKLEPGQYNLRFISDGAHSSDEWRMAIPDHEDFWGIGVYKDKPKIDLAREKEINRSNYKWNARDFEVNEDGTIWMSNQSGMVHYSLEDGVIDRYKTKYKNGLGIIISDPYDDNYLWSLGNDDKPGLCRFNRSTGMFKYYDIDPDKSDDFVFEPNGLEFMNEDEIWLRSNNGGLLRFNHQSGSVSRLKQDRDNGNALRDNRINFLYRDRAGAMWVSTSTMGISIYDPFYQKFGLIPYKQGLIKNSFPNPNISNMGQHIEGSIIFQSGGDYFLFDPIKKELKKNNFGFPENYLMGDFTTSGSIAHFTSWDRDKNIRVLTKYDLQNAKVLDQWFQDRKEGMWRTSLWGWPVEEVLFDSRETFWIGYVQANAISAKMKDSDIFISMRTDLSIFSGKELESAKFIQKVIKTLQGDIPKTLFEDREGLLWFSSGNGKLYKIDVENRKIDKFFHNSQDSTSIPSGMIISISEDNRDNLWIGTWPTGMARFNKKTGKSKRFYEKERGLIDNTVNAIIPDDDGYLWISTKNGICRFNPVTENFLDYYYAEDGLQSNEFLFDAAIKGKDGSIYFGGSNGVSYVEPEKIYKNPNPPMIDISSVYKDGEKVIFGSDVNGSKKLNVTYRDRGIAFDFNGLNYTRTMKNQYKYRMVGYDPDWINAGGRRFTSYTNLPPGEYIFQVTGSNNDGLWNENPAEVQVNVFPPPWATWWAYAIYLVLIASGIYSYLQYVKDRDKRENEELRKTEELELARQFQLDLLPSNIPKLPEYDIAAKIDTATEVGGDYYDFFEQPDGSIYLVTGDATGHGMTAGMMVSITKAGLHGISQPDTKDIMNQLNTVIKNIDLGQNRMALNIGHLKNGSVEFSSAGMPPLYMYNSKEKKLKEVLQVGLPLGSLKSEDYISDVYEFNSGDVMIFLSDGLPEATNTNDEMLGYEAVYDCMLENIDQEPQDLLDTLSKLGSDWIKGTQLDDDITLLVVKKR